MPEKLKSCVRQVEKIIKPRRKGQSKESAAFAVCVKSTGQKPHKKAVKKNR